MGLIENSVSATDIIAGVDPIKRQLFVILGVGRILLAHGSICRDRCVLLPSAGRPDSISVVGAKSIRGVFVSRSVLSVS